MLKYFNGPVVLCVYMHIISVTCCYMCILINPRRAWMAQGVTVVCLCVCKTLQPRLSGCLKHLRLDVYFVIVFR